MNLFLFKVHWPEGWTPPSFSSGPVLQGPAFSVWWWAWGNLRPSHHYHWCISNWEGLCKYKFILNEGADYVCNCAHRIFLFEPVWVDGNRLTCCGMVVLTQLSFMRFVFAYVCVRFTRLQCIKYTFWQTWMKICILWFSIFIFYRFENTVCG